MELSDFIIKGDNKNSLAFSFVNGLITTKNNTIINHAKKGEDLKNLMIAGANLVYDSIKLLTLDSEGYYQSMRLGNLNEAITQVPGLSKYSMIKKPEINEVLDVLHKNKGFIIGFKSTYDNPFNSVCVYSKNGEILVKDNSSPFDEPFKFSLEKFNEYLKKEDWALIKESN